MVSDITQQQSGICFMDDQPDIGIDADGPEVGIFRPIQPVKLHAWMGRVKLQVEGCGLDNFLFLTGQLSEAIRKGVGDAEFHHVTRNTFITSSPR